MYKSHIVAVFCMALASLCFGCNGVSGPSKHEPLAQGDTTAVSSISHVSTPQTAPHVTDERIAVTTNASAVPIADLKALIKKTAQASKCSSDSDNLSSAVTGVAIVFGRGICRANQPWVIAASRGNLRTKTDALNSYKDRFKTAGLPISDQPSPDNLRHLFTLMYGLMQHESNGRSCVGKDPSQDYDEADSAEAGLFQASWGLHRHDAVMGQLATDYSKIGSNTPSCLKEEFDKSRPRCRASDAITWPKDGDGQSEGEKYQKMAKDCPAFATEFAAVGLRVNGGNTKKTGEWNPLMSNIKEEDKARVYPSCETMLAKVQELVEANMTSCDQLFH